MATVIEAAGDKIKIDKGFVSGKDRISVNGEVVFEGKLTDDEPQNIYFGSREYTLRQSVVSRTTRATAIQLHIFENKTEVHSGLYDQHGKPVKDQAEAKSNGAVQVCGIAGGVIGVIVMLVLNRETGIVPGGAIGGAIGGGVGSAIGYGVGGLIFGSK
ncbi:hypothetical protein [Bremerella alba]|uniref:hypothetical protein n=1 Tax=Bremerella alba TaxID=980252 RepID=UPI001A9551FC|nr:hypothetical protein [Bremerella alba]